MTRTAGQDSGEWVLPGVPVTLAPVVGAARTDGLAAALAPRTTVTGPDGSYRFDGVAPGRWTVTAEVTAAGFAYTSDTDGALDWTVLVDAAPGATATASFAGLGKGTLQGVVFSSTTGAPIGGADVRCRWDGFDDLPGTADDLLLTVRSAADGSYVLGQVPYGGYSCGAVDPATGRSSAPAPATVMSVVPVRADLPITPSSPVTPSPVTPPSPVPPVGTPVAVPVADRSPQAAPVRPAPVRGTPVAAPRPGALARTGADTSAVLLVGLALLVAGAGATAAARTGGLRRR